MRKILLSAVFASALFMSNAEAQTTFSENFDSFNSGDQIALSDPVNWTTWSNQPGSAEDAFISDEQAFSGTNSLKLEGAQGPTDLVLLFGDKYEFGTFDFSTQLYVESGKGAYWNFQAEEAIGTTWALEFYFASDGTYRLNSSSTDHLTGTYTQGEWLDVHMNIDLTGNVWSLYINDELQGSFANPVNYVASCDIFPYETVNGALFYMDDISFEYQPPVLLDNDIATVDVKLPFTSCLAGKEVEVDITVLNAGANNVESLSVSWTDANGNVNEESVTGLNLASFESAVITHSVPYTVVDGSQSIDVTVSNPNGVADDNMDNNIGSGSINGLTPANGRKVLAEEVTGTWCGFCPSGIVMFNRLKAGFEDHFIGVAVHSGDPMEYPTYIDYLFGNFGLTGYPGVVINRESNMHPLNMVTPFETVLTTPTDGIIEFGAELDATTGQYTIGVQTSFNENQNGEGYRVNAVIIENDVTGTSSGFDQANYYSGDPVDLDGWESLPPTVPAAQMSYNEVAIADLGGFAGLDGVIPADIVAGDNYSASFAYIASGDVDLDQLHIVAYITDGDGKVMNANEISLDDALNNGPLSTEAVLTAASIDLNVAPNPATDFASITMTLDKRSDLFVELTDLNGKVVYTSSQKSIQGTYTENVDVSSLSAGIYVVNVIMNDQSITTKLNVTK